MALAPVARITIDSATQGKTELKHVSKIDPKDSRSAKGQAAVGGRVVGVVRGPGEGWTISMTSYVQAGKQECDWFALSFSGEPFILVLEFVGGFKLQFAPTFVSTVSPSADKEGNNTLEIECTALEAKPL
jgi:hypothetical protein